MNLNTQIEYRISTGSGNTVPQSFFSNKNVFVNSGLTNVTSFEKPMYITYGGTTNYYGQDPFSVFTNLNLPFIRYVFTANTFSISGDTEFINRIYKLDYETYKNYNTALTPIDKTQNISSTKLIETTTKTDENGNVTTEYITKETSLQEDSQHLININFTTREQIQNFLQNPYYEYATPVSGMTLPIYDFILSQYIKTSGTTSGDYKKELFEDKSQYFVESFFRIKFPTSPEDYDTYKIYRSGSTEFDFLKFYDYQYYPSYFTGEFNINNFWTPLPSYKQNSIVYAINKYPTLSSNTYDDLPIPITITSTTFSGIEVVGNFFTYFSVPNKPAFENPILQGKLNTFSPIVYFSNVNDGDYYIIEVTYDLNDTGFTNDKKIFNVEKQLNTQNSIQTAIFSIRTNSDFRYRIGNVKTIKNIFDVDQKIITYSDQLTGSTQTEPAETYVFTEVDSPFITQIAPQTNPPMLSFQTPVGYSLSGNVSGSIVTGATLTLQYPGNGGVSAITTDSTGGFVFTGLTAGLYTLTTNYRGYEQDIRSIYINSNLNYGYTIQILWDNEFDTWYSKEDDIILF